MKKQMAKRIATAMLSGVLAFGSAMPVMAANSIDNVSYESIDAYRAISGKQSDNGTPHGNDDKTSDEQVDKAQWSGDDKNLQHQYDAKTGKKTGDEKTQVESYFTKLGQTHTYTVRICTDQTGSTVTDNGVTWTDYKDGGRNGWRFTMTDIDKTYTYTDASSSGNETNPGTSFGTLDGTGVGSGNDKGQIELDPEYKDTTSTKKSFTLSVEDFTDGQDVADYDLKLKWEIVDPDSSISVTLKDGSSETTDANYTLSGDAKTATLTADPVVTDLKVQVNAFGTYKFKIKCTPVWVNKYNSSVTKNAGSYAYTGAYVSLPLSKPALKDLLDSDYKPSSDADAKAHIEETLKKYTFKTSANEDVQLSVFGDVKPAVDTASNKTLADVVLKADATGDDGKTRTFYINLTKKSVNNSVNPNKSDLTMATNDESFDDYRIEFGKASTDVPFADVKDGAWYTAAVTWAKKTGTVSGIGSNLFGVGQEMTRAEFAQILYNNASDKDTGDTSVSFDDVKDNSAWYYKAVIWAASNGYVAGESDGNFHPTDVLTREQLVQILYNLENKPKVTDEDKEKLKFTDVTDDDAWYYDAIVWANANDVTAGKGDGKTEEKGTTFGLGENITREQGVQLYFNYKQYKDEVTVTND